MLSYEAKGNGFQNKNQGGKNMNVAGINTSSQSNTPVQQSTQDSYETDIRKQISNLQEKRAI